MTFGSTFGRVLSPTFQPKSQAAGGGWWDLNGTITSCVAAYQPKGAASYAASKVNLANPGTYNATEGNAPTWNTATGWTFDGVDDYLDTGVSPEDNQGWSFFIRIANNQTNDTKYAFGTGTSFRSSFSVIPKYNTTYAWIANDTRVYIKNGATDNGVLGCSGADVYINAVKKGTCSVDLNNTFSNSAYIGTSRGAANYWAGDVVALAIYNGALTITQVGLLTTAMNAL